MRKILTVLLCLGALISWQIWQGDIVFAKDKIKMPKGKAFECSIAGTWLAAAGDGFATFIPTDPTGRRFSLMVDNPLPQNPTLYGVFPTAKALTPVRGVAVKVSPNIYQHTVSQIAVDDSGIPLGELEVTGYTKLIDCDTREVFNNYRFLDADGKELWEGYCEPESYYSYRYEIVSPCGELPPFIK